MHVLREELEEYLRMTEALHELAQADALALRRNDTGSLARHAGCRRALLLRLSGANHRLRQHRMRWERLPQGSRDPGNQIGDLVRRTLGSILRTVSIERLNERGWPRFQPQSGMIGTLQPAR
jgi:hypothetical protein